MNGHPALLPLRLYRGDDYIYRLRLWSDRAHTLPIPLDGVDAIAEITLDGVTIPFTATVTLPNQIDLELSSDDWVGIEGKSGQWDLQLELADASIFTLLHGMVVVSGDVVP